MALYRLIRCSSLWVLGLAAISAGCGEATPGEIGSARSSQAAASTSGRYIITFDAGVPADLASQVAALGGAVDFTHGAGYAIVSGLTDPAAAQLGQGVGVVAVLPDTDIEMDPTSSTQIASVNPGPQSPSDPSAASLYAAQWNMRAIHADAAWARGRLGSPAVTVAILDTGIDYTYPDLSGRVDLSRSASFVPFDDALVAAYFPGKHPVTDLHFHGTHVASTVVSNGWGVAGVTSKTTLIGVKVCSVAGTCSMTALLQGILHALDRGADVINLSLGGSIIKAENAGVVELIKDLGGTLNEAGVTVVVAAGNGATDLNHNGSTYAAYCDSPNTICVSATAPIAGGFFGPWTDIDTPTSYTNFGSSAISVAAPGGDYGQWVHAACSQTSLVLPMCRTGWYVLSAGGTSMATPHVTGLAALVVEDVGRHPGQVRTRIGNGADDLGKPGMDPFFGRGRINVDRTAQ